MYRANYLMKKDKIKYLSSGTTKNMNFKYVIFINRYNSHRKYII